MSRKTEAIKLRVKGKSYTEISEALGGIAKSTLSNWLSEQPLSTKAKKRLARRRQKATYRGQYLGSLANKHKAQKQRRELLLGAQEEFSEVNIDYPSAALVGAALYWAEGTKGKGFFKFTNSNPEMLWFIRQWLTQVLGVEVSDLRCAVHVYLNNGMTYSEIERWWATRLKLPKEGFRKPQINKAPRSSKKKRPNRLLYGTLVLSVSRPQRYRAKYFALLEKLGGDSTPFINIG